MPRSHPAATHKSKRLRTSTRSSLKPPPPARKPKSLKQTQNFRQSSRQKKLSSSSVGQKASSSNDELIRTTSTLNEKQNNKRSIYCIGCKKFYHQYTSSKEFIRKHALTKARCKENLIRCRSCSNMWFLSHSDFLAHLQKNTVCYNNYITSRHKSDDFNTTRVAIRFTPISKDVHIGEKSTDELTLDNTAINKRSTLKNILDIEGNIEQPPTYTYNSIHSDNSAKTRVFKKPKMLSTQLKELRDSSSVHNTFDLNIKNDLSKVILQKNKMLESQSNALDVIQEQKKAMESFNKQNSVLTRPTFEFPTGEDDDENESSNEEDHEYEDNLLQLIDMDDSDDEYSYVTESDESLISADNDEDEREANFVYANNMHEGDNTRNNNNELVTNGRNHLLHLTNTHKQERSSLTTDKEYNDALKMILMLMKMNVPITEKWYNMQVQWKYNDKSFISLNEVKTRAISRVYGETLGKKLHPKNNRLCCPSGRHFNVITFDFDAVVWELLSDEDLNQHENLIFKDGNEEDPFNIEDGETYADFDQCEYYSETVKKMTSQDVPPGEPPDLICPVIIYIDETRVDSNSKLNLHPVVLSFMIYNKSTRAKERSWRTIGYIPPINAIIGINSMSPESKLNDLHFILKYIMDGLQQMQSIKEGMYFDFKFKKYDDKIFRRNIMFPLGLARTDGKAADTWCCKFQNRATSKFICRDCDCLLSESDKHDVKCEFRKMKDLLQLDKKELNSMCFHKIDGGNAFSNIDFGGNIYGINAATPPDPCHMFNKGIVERLPSILCARLSKKMVKELDINVGIIASKFCRQSLRDLPEISQFKNGATEAAKLTADENIKKIFVLFLTLLHVDYELKVVGCKGRKPNQETPATIITQDEYNKWILVFEDLLILHSWIYLDQHPKVFFNGGSKSEVNKRIRKFMKSFKQNANRIDGKGLKLMKYHQLLHLWFYIRMFGSLHNVNTARNESHHKKKKKLASRTQRRMSLLDYQTAESEFYFNLYLEAMKLSGIEIDGLFEVFQYDIQPNNNNENENQNLNEEIDNDTDENKKKNPSRGSKFLLTFDYVNDKLVGSWISKKKKGKEFPLHPHIGYSLFDKLNGYNHSQIGKRITSIEGFTEYSECDDFKDEFHVFRACPDYRNSGDWYDWAYINWGEDFTSPVQLLMFLDMTSMKFEDDPIEGVPLHEKISLEVAVLFHSTRDGSMRMSRNPAATIRLQDERGPMARIVQWYEMETTYQLIDAKSICDRCFAVVDRCGVVSENNNILVGNARDIFIVKPMREWSKYFLDYDSEPLLEDTMENQNLEILETDERFPFEF